MSCGLAVLDFYNPFPYFGSEAYLPVLPSNLRCAESHFELQLQSFFVYTNFYNRSSLVDWTSMIIPPIGVFREVETNNESILMEGLSKSNELLQCLSYDMVLRFISGTT